MKTYHIKDLLKSDLLIVELPEQGFIFRRGGFGYDCYIVRNNITNKDFFINDYVVLGKPDELTEEDAAELVEFGYNNEKFTERYRERDYKNYSEKGKVYFETAKESLLSATEAAGVLWDNPLPKPQKTNLNNSFFDMQVSFNDEVKFDEAELRTFDRNRTLIFVKN